MPTTVLPAGYPYSSMRRGRASVQRERIGEIEVGEAAYPPAFALPAKYIIHTVEPA